MRQIGSILSPSRQDSCANATLASREERGPEFLRGRCPHWRLDLYTQIFQKSVTARPLPRQQPSDLCSPDLRFGANTETPPTCHLTRTPKNNFGIVVGSENRRQLGIFNVGAVSTQVIRRAIRTFPRINPSAMSSKLPPKSSLHDPETMPSEIAFVQSPTSSCNLESLPISSAVPSHEFMSRSWSLVRPLLAGLVLTALQLTMAVGLLAPEGPASYRYSTLIQHDSFWFMNIVDRGYQTIVPPINQQHDGSV